MTVKKENIRIAEEIEAQTDEVNNNIQNLEDIESNQKSQETDKIAEENLS